MRWRLRQRDCVDGCLIVLQRSGARGICRFARCRRTPLAGKDAPCSSPSMLRPQSRSTCRYATRLWPASPPGSWSRASRCPRCALASDLGINLHTVNKAYAVLRDEGYVRMRGRAGAVIADPAAADRADADASAQVKMEDDLFKLALAFRARGGARGQFLEAAAAQAARAYGVMEDDEAAPRPGQKRKTAGASSSAGAGKAVIPQ